MSHESEKLERAKSERARGERKTETSPEEGHLNSVVLFCFVCEKGRQWCLPFNRIKSKLI